MTRRLDGSDRGVLISKEAARRIQRVVQRSEGGERDIPPLPLRTAYDDGDPVRIGKVTGDWGCGTCATVTLWESGQECVPTENSPAELLEDVANLLHDVKADSWVVVARGESGRWYLLASGKCPGESSCRETIGGEDFTTWPNYNGVVEQLLGHDENGCLKWFDVVECDSGSGS